MRLLNKLFATWFGLGLIPKGPGTWGSIGGMIFVLLVFIAVFEFAGRFIRPDEYLIIALLLFILGCLSANKYDLDHGTEDSKQIVVDEVVGQMLALFPLFGLVDMMGSGLFLIPWKIVGLFFIAFALFRFFDVLKPWPIRLIDRQLKGGFGVMLDDILAGVMAGICVMGVIYVGFGSTGF